jgi:hypothetical protein
MRPGRSRLPSTTAGQDNVIAVRVKNANNADIPATAGAMTDSVNLDPVLRFAGDRGKVDEPTRGGAAR